ncbi:DUF4132 domain-containing protein [Propioniciclava coleopterorum]|uniref:DUF4132 domain-containing protein n=1 Tax=Propioniciclava coleopterorum TaxID=2714937 RepID=A0A6G7Y3D8_9ACTN|nr:DUF4132 domain-containing protein [Propioniciclava coleopterorum]QIK71322.1 DUF4132 domain-containing protein [Propioniciclava coleopterorum]
MLRIATSAVQRALLAGESLAPEPLQDADLALASDPATRRDWVRAHSVPTRDYSAKVVFDALPFDGVPTAAVASWWLSFGQGREKNAADTRPYETPTVRERLAYADKADGPTDLSMPAAFYNLPADTLVTSLFALAGAPDTLAALARARDFGDTFRDLCLPALRALVVPLLADHERVMPPQPAPHPRSWARVSAARQDAEHQLAREALFGTPEEIRAALIQAFAAEEPSPSVVLAAVTGLPDPEERRTWMERVGFGTDPELAASWLALGGERAIPDVLAGLAGEYVDKVQATAIARALAGAISGPGAVPVMLKLATDHRVAPVAVQWLTAHPRAIAASTAEVPAGQRPLLRTIIRELRATTPDAFGDDIASPFLTRVLAELAAEDALPTIGAAEAPPWFTAAAAAEAEAPVAAGALKIAKAVPSWADPASLPPLIVDGVRLDAALTAAVLASAVNGANNEDRAPRPLVAAVRERMRDQDRDALATPLLQAFLANGGKATERPWFVASGYLGADGFVQTLTPLVREWPGQSQHQRAVLGLEVLAATGTDAALQAISGIANKSKFKGVQKAAQEALAKLAALRGLTVEQLEDRVVPDAGLDERGTRTLSYGPRSFRVSLSPQGKAVVRDLDADGRPTGKPRAALPAPNSKDDADLAAAAKADFALLRKQLTEVAKIQTARLEKAIVTGRTWSAAEHAELVVRHPVLNALIRPLVWQASVPGRPAVLVRVTEDQEYVTVDEEAHVPPADAVLSLAHPLTLSDETKSAWRAHLVDYDLIAPLEQLDRATFGLPAGQKGTELLGLPGGTINPGTLVSTLERLGWRRGNPADGGVVSYLWLPFESQGLAAVLDISDGLWTGMIHESGDQKLETLLLGTIKQAAELWYATDRGNRWLPWDKADPLIVSEVRRSIDALAQKMA